MQSSVPNRAAPVPPGLSATRVRPAPQALPVCKGLPVHKVSRAKEGRRARKAPRAPPVLLAPQAELVPKVPIRVPPVRPDSRVQPVRGAAWVPSVYRVRKVLQE